MSSSHVPTGRQRGRPPKPTEAKRRIRNPGHRKLAPTAGDAAQLRSSAALGEKVEPWRPLGSHGRALWDRLLVAGPWLDSADLEFLLLVAESADERAGLRFAVLRDGRRFDRAALRQIDRQLITGLSALGFAPTDRARLGLGEPVEVDELAQLRAKRIELPRPS